MEECSKPKKVPTQTRATGKELCGVWSTSENEKQKGIAQEVCQFQNKIEFDRVEEKRIMNESEQI